MARVKWIVISFIAMYGIATIVGFTTYLLLSPFAMWVSVFTLMPIVSTLLIYSYLRKMRFSRKSSLGESLIVSASWIALSFSFDAVMYILIVPYVSRAASNWTFFQDQSPWIWVSYLALLLSALTAHKVYARRMHA